MGIGKSLKFKRTVGPAHQHLSSGHWGAFNVECPVTAGACRVTVPIPPLSHAIAPGHQDTAPPASLSPEHLSRGARHPYPPPSIFFPIARLLALASLLCAEAAPPVRSLSRRTRVRFGVETGPTPFSLLLAIQVPGGEPFSAAEGHRR
jgi:hypothetical protein